MLSKVSIRSYLFLQDKQLRMLVLTSRIAVQLITAHLLFKTAT